MANNSIINVPSTSGDVISDDQITTLNGAGIATGEKVQRMKIAYGAPASATDVNLTTPLPVLLGSDADNISTGTLAAAAQTVILVIGGKSAASISISGTWAGTITFEGSIDGTIWNSINAVAASTSFPQPTTTVNGLYRLTPAGLLQIRVNMTAFTSGSASISMRASAGTGGVFANQILPARITDGANTVTIKPASTASAVTDLPLVVALHPSSPTPNFAAAQPVNTSTAITSSVIVMQNAVAVTGPGTSLIVTGYGTAVIQIIGVFVATINFEFSVDAGATWSAISATQIGAGDIFSSTTIPGSFRITCTALDLIRARVTWTSGTSITINGRASNAINASKVVKLATGTNIIGTVNIAGTVPVSGTFFQGTQPVSIATMPSTPVTGTFFQATQPISAAALPLPTGAAQDGTDITTPTAMPTGGIGIRGWLSSIWTKLNGSLSVTGSFFQATQPVSIAAMPTTPVTGTFFQATQPVSLATNTPDVIDRAARLLGVLSTGANTIGAVNIAAAQTLAIVTTVSAVTAITNALPVGANTIGAVTNANLDVALSTRLKPADTLAAVTLISDTRQTVAANLQATVTQQALTKGTQGTVGVTTQDLKDAGRNQVHYYTIIPVLTTATDTLQLLTGTKGAATVAATATPAVVTTAKTFRVTRLAATYIATAVSGYGIVRLRFQSAGVATITSPIAATLLVGAGAPTTANSTASEEATLDEGWEFAAATGVGISVQGFAAVTPTAVGYILVSLTGYEY